MNAVFMEGILTPSSKHFIAVIMCITSVLISKIGFSNLVSLLYPIFGYLALVQILKLSMDS